MEVEFDGNPIVEKLCAVKTKHEEEANTVAIVEIINVVLGNSGQWQGVEFSMKQINVWLIETA